MLIKVVQVQSTENNPNGTEIRLRCPACRQKAIFEPLGNDVRIYNGSNALVLGNRRCPDQACRIHVFFAFGVKSDEILITYPPERLDFDASSLPPGVLTALEEAVSCHAAGCYVAAGMMVRKTLEELCAERASTGPNLKVRIENLQSRVVLPKELLDGLDDLRLLGNDAAHIESKVYQQIGKEEIEVSIEFTKEVLKAVYQYTELLSRLRALRKAP
jgi:hypothetical protein